MGIVSSGRNCQSNWGMWRSNIHFGQNSHFGRVQSGGQEYYARLQRALAVVPGFARDTYYKTKASSSVAAALICCTPLIANRDLMTAYSYLNEVMSLPPAPFNCV